MENIAPPLELLMEVRFGLEKGLSLRKTLQAYIEAQPADPWRQQIGLWLQFLEMGRPSQELLTMMTFVRRQCLEVIELGLRGEPIYPQICALEDEVYESAKLEIEEFVAVLPIKSLIPLLFFQFPAFLALLIGPFLTSLLAQS
jgi:hypothetical protein